LHAIFTSRGRTAGSASSGSDKRERKCRRRPAFSRYFFSCPSWPSLQTTQLGLTALDLAALEGRADPYATEEKIWPLICQGDSPLRLCFAVRLLGSICVTEEKFCASQYVYVTHLLQGKVTKAEWCALDDDDMNIDLTHQLLKQKVYHDVANYSVRLGRGRRFVLRSDIPPDFPPFPFRLTLLVASLVVSKSFWVSKRLRMELLL